MWSPNLSTTLRFAAFHAVKRPLWSSQSLEPTHVAGFNQFFDDFNGAESTRVGIGVDQRFGADLFAGLELSWRDLDQQFRLQNASREEDHDELFHRAYLYWAPAQQVSLGGEYTFESFERDSIQVTTSPDELRTHRVPMTLRYYHPSGLFLRLGATFVHQELAFPGENDDEESFWVADAAVGYRLPKRYGLLSLETQNIFNQNFRFQSSFDPDIEPRASLFEPERAVFARVSLWFY